MPGGPFAGREVFEMSRNVTGKKDPFGLPPRSRSARGTYCTWSRSARGTYCTWSRSARGTYRTWSRSARGTYRGGRRAEGGVPKCPRMSQVSKARYSVRPARLAGPTAAVVAWREVSANVRSGKRSFWHGVLFPQGLAPTQMACRKSGAQQLST